VSTWRTWRANADASAGRRCASAVVLQLPEDDYVSTLASSNPAVRSTVNGPVALCGAPYREVNSAVVLDGTHAVFAPFGTISAPSIRMAVYSAQLRCPMAQCAALLLSVPYSDNLYSSAISKRILWAAWVRGRHLPGAIATAAASAQQHLAVPRGVPLPDRLSLLRQFSRPCDGAERRSATPANASRWHDFVPP